MKKKIARITMVVLLGIFLFIFCVVSFLSITGILIVNSGLIPNVSLLVIIAITLIMIFSGNRRTAKPGKRIKKRKNKRTAKKKPLSRKELLEIMNYDFDEENYEQQLRERLRRRNQEEIIKVANDFYNSCSK